MAKRVGSTAPPELQRLHEVQGRLNKARVDLRSQNVSLQDSQKALARAQAQLADRDEQLRELREEQQSRADDAQGAAGQLAGLRAELASSRADGDAAEEQIAQLERALQRERASTAAAVSRAADEAEKAAALSKAAWDEGAARALAELEALKAAYAGEIQSAVREAQKLAGEDMQRAAADAAASARTQALEEVARLNGAHTEELQRAVADSQEATRHLAALQGEQLGRDEANSALTTRNSELEEELRVARADAAAAEEELLRVRADAAAASQAHSVALQDEADLEAAHIEELRRRDEEHAVEMRGLRATQSEELLRLKEQYTGELQRATKQAAEDTRGETTAAASQAAKVAVSESQAAHEAIVAALKAAHLEELRRNRPEPEPEPEPTELLLVPASPGGSPGDDGVCSPQVRTQLEVLEQLHRAGLLASEVWVAAQAAVVGESVPGGISPTSDWSQGGDGDDVSPTTSSGGDVLTTATHTVGTGMSPQDEQPEAAVAGAEEDRKHVRSSTDGQQVGAGGVDTQTLQAFKREASALRTDVEALRALVVAQVDLAALLPRAARRIVSQIRLQQHAAVAPPPPPPQPVQIVHVAPRVYSVEFRTIMLGLRKAVQHGNRTLFGKRITDGRTLFLAIDKHREGVIYRADLAEALKRLGLLTSETRAEALIEEVALLHERTNSDGSSGGGGSGNGKSDSGTVDWQEFLHVSKLDGPKLPTRTRSGSPQAAAEAGRRARRQQLALEEHMNRDPEWQQQQQGTAAGGRPDSNSSAHSAPEMRATTNRQQVDIVMERNLSVPAADARAAAFKRADVNGNGFLHLHEMKSAALELWPQLLLARVGGGGRRQEIHPAVIQSYHAADENNDGQIGRREWRQFCEYVVYFAGRWDVFAKLGSAVRYRDGEQTTTVLDSTQFKHGCAELELQQLSAASQEQFSRLVASSAEAMLAAGAPAGAQVILLEIFATWCAKLHLGDRRDGGGGGGGGRSGRTGSDNAVGAEGGGSVRRVAWSGGARANHILPSPLRDGERRVR